MAEGAPRAASDLSARVACLTHALSRETWVTCVHADPTRDRARLIDDPRVRGEAVCPACRRALDSGEKPIAYLRLACGGCVRARFRLEESN